MTPTGVLVVTGTGTDVGKTIVSAGIASLALRAGQRVCVVKPVQTGVGPTEAGDLDTVTRLSGARDTREFKRFRNPLAPAAAARVSGQAPLDLHATADRIRGLANDYDLVIVEGAGGLLVRYDARLTIADMATSLGAPLVVVASPNLGTLNHTALTLEALKARELKLAGLVIGSWPREPDLACRSNVTDLCEASESDLAGAMTAGCGMLDPVAFLAVADDCLSPTLGGSFDGADFRRRFEYRRHD